jgi:hypothetical protein
MDKDQKALADAELKNYTKLMRQFDERLADLCAGLPDGEPRFYDIKNCHSALMIAEKAVRQSSEDPEYEAYAKAWLEKAAKEEQDSIPLAPGFVN